MTLGFQPKYIAFLDYGANIRANHWLIYNSAYGNIYRTGIFDTNPTVGTVGSMIETEGTVGQDSSEGWFYFNVTSTGFEYASYTYGTVNRTINYFASK